MIISSPLWINDRLLPPLPVFDFILTYGWLHYTILACLFLSGLFSLFNSKLAKYSLVSFLCILLFLCLQDMNRWQPWIYLFFILLSVICISRLDIISKDKVPELFQIAFIGIYFWSGIHKFNAGFTENIFPEMNPFNFDLGIFGYLIPLTEASFGIGLIFRKTRNLCVVLLIVMHLIIFTCVLFGPWLYDLVIIPWNIGMVVMLLVLFTNNTETTLFKSFSFSKACIISLFIFLPTTNFMGFWHSYPSFSLFSGKTDRAFLYVDEDFKSNFSSSTVQYIDDDNRLFVQRYSYSELNIPFYPEQKSYLKLFKKLCEKTDNDLSLILEIQTLPDLFENKWEKKVYFCDDF